MTSYTAQELVIIRNLWAGTFQFDGDYAATESARGIFDDATYVQILRTLARKGTIRISDDRQKVAFLITEQEVTAALAV